MFRFMTDDRERLINSKSKVQRQHINMTFFVRHERARASATRYNDDNWNEITMISITLVNIN